MAQDHALAISQNVNFCAARFAILLTFILSGIYGRVSAFYCFAVYLYCFRKSC